MSYFNENKKDFEEHNRTIEISNGKFEMKDTTKPYGFVPTDAKVWFQQYQDDDAVIREYLCTEGYLWTGQYPECQRIIDKGNNQSMELDTERIDAYWTKDENEKPQFFIINEAIVSKLCILGEDCEPCFEGASVTKPETEIKFSLGDDFKEQLFSMMQEIKDLLVDNKEGGARVFTRYSVEIGDSLWNALYSHVYKTYSIEEVCEDGDQKFAILKDSEGNFSRLDFSLAEDGTVTFADEVSAIEYTSAEEAQFSAEAVEAFVAEFKKKEEDKKDKDPEDGSEDKSGKSDNSNSEDNSEGDKSDSSKSDNKEKDDKKDDEEDEKKKKGKFSLEEIPEYVELSTKFSELESKYNALVAERDSLQAQLQPLVEFKAKAERTQKEDMIKSFYMLSDEDKADVVANIDTYSLDDIEAKLSILCVRNKVSFNLDDDKDSKKDPMVYNLGGSIEDDASTPAWVKAAIKTAEKLK